MQFIITYQSNQSSMKLKMISILSNIFKVQVFTVRTQFNDWVQSYMLATSVTHSLLIYSCIIIVSDKNFFCCHRQITIVRFCWVVREKHGEKMTKRRLRKQLIDKIGQVKNSQNLKKSLNIENSMSVKNDNTHSRVSYLYRNMVVKIHFYKYQLYSC